MLGTLSRGAVSAFAALFMMGSASAGGRGYTGPGFRPQGAAHNGVIRAGTRFRVGVASHSFGGVARGLPPLAGVIHEGPGRSPYFTSYGHLNTASRVLADRGAVRFGFDNRPNGIVARDRLVRGARFADRFRRDRFAGGFGGAYPYAAADGGPLSYGGSYPSGDYGGAYGGSAAGTAATLASEPPLSSYAEPPLGPSPYGPAGGYDDAAGGGSPGAGAALSAAGPQIIIVNNVVPARSRACPCSARARSPVVYRYGVPAPY